MSLSGKKIAIIGGGPAGLMAAEILSAHNLQVTVYERKPSVCRKFLMAGRGGLNLTHSEDINSFIKRYGSKAEILDPAIRRFTPQNLQDWCESLGEKTFKGSSGRIFPESFKASPLLRAWVKRLEKQNVRFMLNHDWKGWNEISLAFKTPAQTIHVNPDATLLALGGASWPRLGSDGSWLDILKAQDISCSPLAPANCGFHAEWSHIFQQKFSGQPLKSVKASFSGIEPTGEIMITERGIEGGAVYALSSSLRDEIYKQGNAVLGLDLKPDLGLADITEKLKKPRKRDSLSNFLRKTLNLSPVAIGLIMESKDREALGNYSPEKMARLIKNYPLNLTAPFPIEKAISTAGGIRFEEMDHHFMLIKKPGVFAAGEMLDWEAPTGGYLLQASFSTGVVAAQGMMEWLSRKIRS